MFDSGNKIVRCGIDENQEIFSHLSMVSVLFLCLLLPPVFGCPPGKTLSDCSVSRVTMPLLPADDQYSEHDKYRDDHPLFPRDDVFDIVVTSCNASIQQNKYSQCTMFIRSTLFNLTTVALMKPHGGDMINLSWRVKTNIFDLKGFILKDTQDSDPSFLKERLSMLALRYAGAKVQRECKE